MTRTLSAWRLPMELSTRTLARVSMLPLLIVATAQLASSQEPRSPRPMTLVDLLNVPSLSDPQLSPDGRQILYVVARADWKANRRIGQIWRANLDGSAAVQLTTGANDAGSPQWSPDGNTIAFATRREAPQAQV